MYWFVRLTDSIVQLLLDGSGLTLRRYQTKVGQTVYLPTNRRAVLNDR